jgi:hypothetical protein
MGHIELKTKLETISTKIDRVQKGINLETGVKVSPKFDEVDYEGKLKIVYS